ncbi:methyltransferase domain-containing protein [Pyrobaculum sp.]|uniref:Methylase involved in ubiquinone/menaquinone biosynthesis n=1 Tax=Pyrobaculum oguniense (strain DSM 13380 / JCM 10595 / TE7) TaxID=698757 RepID=H6Q7E8_PYROT|nr:Methylase involved in ubiquinone/menaquinone biosynthesis [Pyrobaculum oguniense TE7]
MGLGERWYEIREAYRKIVDVYERANKIVTLGNVDRWRREALSLYYSVNGRSVLKILDAGAGPGNMAHHLRGTRYLVAFDASIEMLRLNNVADDRVVGMFEQMPFRDESFDLLISGYALHAAVDLEKAAAEFSRVANYQVVVAIGKPDRRVARCLVLAYAKFVVPRVVCIVAPRQICREYGKIYEIMASLPPNSRIRQIISRYAHIVQYREKGLGSVYIYVAKSRNHA